MPAAGCFLLLVLLAQLELAPGAGNRLALEVYKTGLWSGRKHLFTFDRYSANVSYDEQQPERSQVQLRVAATSIQNLDPWVNEKDRKKIVSYALHDMLQAERYPELEFRSTRVSATAANRFQMEGLLALRGVLKPVTIAVTVQPGFVFEGSARLKMTDWGMKPPSAALGTIGTRDEMEVTFRLAARAAAATK